MTDLHLHSTASDGYLSPGDLMRYVKESGVKLCALTDHDTMDGIAEASEVAIQIGIRCISGIELSCLSDDKSVHLLGYFNCIAPATLMKELVEIQKWRAKRNPKMLDKLQELGISISMNEVKQEANGGQIGRPHIARAMIKKGVVRNLDEAFEKYLGNGKPAYIEKDRLSLHDAVTLVHNSGGIAILAHPMVYNFVNHSTVGLLCDASVKAGVDGIEAYYTEHKKADRKRIEHLTKRAGLLVTGGSDFHGPTTGFVQPGRGYGDLALPEEYITEFLAKIAALPN